MTNAFEDMIFSKFGQPRASVSMDFELQARRESRITQAIMNSPAPQRLLNHIAAEQNPYRDGVPEAKTMTARFLRATNLTMAVNNMALVMGLEKPIKGISLRPEHEQRHHDPAMRIPSKNTL